MVKTENSLLSPPSEAASSIVPLNSSIRTTAIHPDLPEIKVPGEPLPAHCYHPVTCQPIDEQDVSAELEQLRQEFPTREMALEAQEQAAKEVKQKIQEAEKKKEEIQKEMDKKNKQRDTELKVVSKYHQVKSSDIP